jgi:hypothetical protein
VKQCHEMDKNNWAFPFDGWCDVSPKFFLLSFAVMGSCTATVLGILRKLAMFDALSGQELRSN